MKNLVFVAIFLCSFSSYAMTTDRDPNQLIKINSQGRYLDYPGVTVVSHVAESRRSQFDRFYDLVSDDPLLNQWYAPLPPGSYHMTAITLFTERWHGGGNWKDFIDRGYDWYQQLVSSLADSHIHPVGLVGQPEVDSAIIYLPVQVTEDVRSKIYGVAERFRVSRNVPSFHVTVAYAYRPIPDEIQKEVVMRVRSLFAEAFASEESRSTVFHEPRLCYFRDMTSFHLWDGKTYPF